MTEYSSDEEDRRGHNSSDLTPDDFDFDISSYTNQSSFFRSQLPVENKKTERHRSKTDSRNTSKVKEAKMSAVIVGGEGSKISCRICGDTAVKHVHYGGHCCFSCKAFFRRAVNWQNKNNRTFQCKFENKCEITIKNRKTCQSCRFQKCMTTGMNPSWVLSEEQRKKRFKKYRDRDGVEGDENDLSPASSQDSERENGMVVDRNGNSRDAEVDNYQVVATRRRAKSAQEPLHRQLSSTTGRYPRNNRLSGPPVMGIAVPVIKMEKDQFEMSPLRDDFAIDFPADQHQPKYLTDDGASIKIEPDIDLDLCLNESLEGLMENYTFENEVDIKPDIKSHEKDFSPTESSNNSNNQSQLPAVPTGICLQLSEEDMMHIYKIEMSFENSNNSIPVMSEETSQIWSYISKSCNLTTISQSFTGSLLTEAVEFSLKRNLIFLQENSDFTSLSLKDRMTLYNRNMGSMCHVRAVMQHGSSNLCPTLITIGGVQIGGPPGEQFEISYKNHKTGKVRRWNLMELPLEEVALVKTYKDSTETENIYNSQKSYNGDCQKKSLLNLAESLWSLELERTSYLILLLIVLFSSQGGQVDNLKDVDRFQNQYMMLLYRYLQAKHGQEKVHQYLSKIMTFVLNLLTNSY